MKRWGWIALLVLAGCCDEGKQPTQSVVINNKIAVEMEPSSAKAAVFCNEQGRYFIGVDEYDWIDIGKGYSYQITCGRKK